VIYKWQDECERWLPGRTTAVITKGSQKFPETDVIIMSYAMMVTKFKEIGQTDLMAIIMDEAHYIKGGTKTQRGRVARALLHGATEHLLLLSGTPFMNNPGELYPLLNGLDPVGFDNYFRFATRYCGAEKIGTTWYFPKDRVTNRVELEQRLEHYLIRRTKQEVELQLPDLTRVTVPLPLEHASIYKTAVKEFSEWRNVNKRVNPLVKLTKLREMLGNMKVEACLDLAYSILDAGRKVVIFAHHKAVVAELTRELYKFGVGVISGDVTAQERKRQADEFMLDTDKIRVMIITVAGSEGINLFSASDIIFCEREWTPAKEEQAEARLHRIGQKSAVTAYYLVVMDTIDEKMDALVREKRNVFGQVLSTDEITEYVVSLL
jgi:SWI/SNF-related matrix-associated actin-dependent regulator 1 of chromatin subfamily A